MKKLIIYTMLLSAVMLSGSCKKELDINTDPNNPSLANAEPNLLFPSAVAYTAGRIGGELAIVGGIWSQLWTQSVASNQYKNIDAYQVTRADFNGSWNELFSGALTDYATLIRIAKEREDWNFVLMGTVMRAYTYTVLVDLYDQVPFSEASQGEANLTPKFDPGDVIYSALLAEIDEALSKDFTARTNTLPGTSDVVFQSSSFRLDAWIAFANTLKLKMFLRMINAKPADAATGVRALYTENAPFLEEDAALAFYINQPDKSNPLYEENFRRLNTTTNIRLSMTFYSWLATHNDPRVNEYFTIGAGGPLAINQGDFNNPATNPWGSASNLFIDPTSPVHFISKAESYFLQAEAVERYFNGTAPNGTTGKELYNAGVTAAFAQVGLTPGALLTGDYAYPAAGTLEQKIEAIIVQKWASLSNSHSMEAFFEKNRTGFPRTSAVYSNSTDGKTWAANYMPGYWVYPKNAVTNGLFIKRFVFPDSEIRANPNVPALVPPTTPVWWAIK
ncbi:SusD/RagB family nutrient-binding outer membrane lipoprotein [uncultured Chitinophaga sp.]|jgi:hypothetical protein|uniref:SusD/RagB family nutrient-binding outer membrane lipoprotein n=1 Tax=uncultured Chitinophaga sp. TaxID=339340 RepID=UPI00261EEF9C|nr:SusD/RagB family nutrient-binding outer membrane lipoprotein [uncultured Chitinophaga sp.]